MFKNIKIYISIILCSLLLTSCFTDEGNYNYEDILEVEFNGIEEDYTVTRFENFAVNPDLVLTEQGSDESRFTYRWVAVAPELPIHDDLTELATTKNLNLRMDLLPGNYTIYYFVKDNVTGVEWQHDFELQVVNNVFEGWLVLNEVSGGSRLDMISLIDDNYVTYHDILDIVGSELTLEGTPGFVYTYTYQFDYYGIYVTTSGNGTTKLEPNVFTWSPDNDISKEFAIPLEENIELANLKAKGLAREAYAIKDGDIYQYLGIQNKAYNLPLNTGFKVSPMFAEGGFAPWVCFYDVTNKEFKRILTFGGFFPMPAGTLFDWNTGGKELIYLSSSRYLFPGNHGAFTILKDPNDGKFYLGVFQTGNFGQIYYGEILATDFDQATNFTFSPDFGYLFYSVGGKVYQYDFSLGTTKLMLDKGSQEITLLKFHNFLSFNYQDLQRQLIVCSYDASQPEGSNGTMELYTVPPVNGQIELETSYSGFGKIKSISYRER